MASTKKPSSPMLAQEQGAKTCHHVGCAKNGDYPAPRSREAPRPYLWFCKEHVVAYNKSWDWYKGMNQDEIINDQLADLTWRRPTYSMKDRLGRVESKVIIEDPLAMLYNNQPSSVKDKNHGKPRDPNSFSIPTTDHKPYQSLRLLGLENPVSFKDIKNAYRQLAVRYHPDKNPNRANAKDFQKINAAYQELKKWVEQKINLAQ